MLKKILYTLSIVIITIVLTLALTPHKATKVETKTPQQTQTETEVKYIANKNTKKFHYPDCKSVKDMKESNKKELNCTRDEAIKNGYSPCGRCNP